MPTDAVRRWPGAWGPLAAQLLAVSAWLWPIGFGGRMPVGGDVTQFSIGLMAFLSRALRSWRLPLWNDRWGYGFPGIGESQMGVFYPPHWLIYGLLPLEGAYTTSLVLHTLWGSVGAYWCARAFGVSREGSALAGFAWSTCGFFLIHLSHQWGYTTGCWMPWAWGTAWLALRGERRAYWLALVLAVQLLPGHFQLAFCTQVGVALMAGWHALECRRDARAGLVRSVRVLGALGFAFLLAGAQVWPTARLARLASSRGFEYLSGFAVSPLHLVTFVAPGLFERSPLWRPIVWEPFHTSPEEYLGYVGLVPLFLAIGATLGGFRKSPGVRALVVVGVVSLFLGLGPYVPGFRRVCALPGFSFFRAPARWTLALGLVLSVLAGLGFDRLRAWPHLGRDLRRFVAGAFVVTGVTVLLVEMAIASPGWPAVKTLYARGFDRLPWHETGVFSGILAASRGPNHDIRVRESLARQGVRLRESPRPVFRDRRFTVYRQELAGTAALLAALLVLAFVAERRAWVRGAFVVLTLLDLGSLGRHRRVDVAPIVPLSVQSPVLGRLAALPRGTRTVDPVRNLPMAAGAAPVSSYRTLDLPALESLTSLAGYVPKNAGEGAAVAGALRLTGAEVRILEHDEIVEAERVGTGRPGLTGVERVRDPSLAGWRLGVDRVAQEGPSLSTFEFGRVKEGGTRAWLVPLTPSRSAAILGAWSGRPLEVLSALSQALPLELRASDPEHRDLDVRATGPGLVVVSELADPQWEGAWSGTGGGKPAVVRRAFGRPGQGAWIAVEVPGAGEWRLRLVYQGRDVRAGLWLSAASLGVWLFAVVRSRRGAGSRGGGERP